MFWGLIVKQGKKYSKVVEQDFQLTHAALDLTASTGDVQVMLTTDNITYLLCTLNKSIPQVRLDQQFAAGDNISFATKGQGVVHLTGNVLPDEFGDMDDDDEVDDEEMEEEEVNGKARNAKQAAKAKVAKEIASGEVPSESDEEDATFSESMLEDSVTNGADEDDDDEEDDDEDDEDDDDDEDEDDDDDEDDEDDEDDDDEEEEEEEKKPAQQQQKKAAPQNQKQAKQGKESKQANDSKGSQNGNASPKESAKEAPKKQEVKPVRTLQDGLVVEDLKVGTGPEAKPGKKVMVYYEGRLKSNNKVFDSTKQGPGLKFALGKGEVIKGWDLGVAGMKVGGKRKLIIPHKLAYGTKGAPPTIPPNSTLVFEVELRKVL